MNFKDYGEQNPATPSATTIAHADLELARAYLAKHAPDFIDMVLGAER